MSTDEFTESGITVDLSGKVHHRFEALPTYIKLKGQSVKEMDVCWLEPEQAHLETGRPLPARLICLELKGYQEADITMDVIEWLVSNLEQKAKDTLLMLCAAWLQRGDGADLSQELPEEYRTYHPDREIQLIMLIDEDNQQAAALMALRQKLRNHLLGMSKLLDFKLTLINLSTAQRISLPVSATSTTQDNTHA